MKTIYDVRIKNMEDELEKLYDLRNKEIETKKKACKHDHVVFTKSSWVDKGLGLDREYPLMILECKDCETRFGDIKKHDNRLISMQPSPIKICLQKMLDLNFIIPKEIQDATKIKVYESHQVVRYLANV